MRLANRKIEQEGKQLPEFMIISLFFKFNSGLFKKLGPDMPLELETASGRIEYIGTTTENAEDVQYSSINIKSESGQNIALSKTCAPKSFAEFISVGKTVSLNYIHIPTGTKYLIFMQDGKQKCFNAKPVATQTGMVIIFFVIFSVMTLIFTWLAFHKPYIGTPLAIISCIISLILFFTFRSYGKIMIEAKKMYDAL